MQQKYLIGDTIPAAAGETVQDLPSGSEVKSTPQSASKPASSEEKSSTASTSCSKEESAAHDGSRKYRFRARLTAFGQYGRRVAGARRRCRP